MAFLGDVFAKDLKVGDHWFQPLDATSGDRFTVKEILPEGFCIETPNGTLTSPVKWASLFQLRYVWRLDEITADELEEVKQGLKEWLS